MQRFRETARALADTVKPTSALLIPLLGIFLKAINNLNKGEGCMDGGSHVHVLQETLICHVTWGLSTESDAPV